TMQTLDKVPAEAWRLLVRREGAWRTPVLASVAAKGADARTVVLRSADAAGRELLFYTDRRSAKHAQLRVVPRVCLVIYDADRQWQLRLYGSAREETRAQALDACWRELSL